MKKSIFFYFIVLLSMNTMAQDSMNTMAQDSMNLVFDTVTNSYRIPGVNPLVTKQLTFPRVNNAYNYHYQTISDLFTNNGLTFPNTTIYWRAFKWNKELELWAYSPDIQQYTLIKTYPICEIVGDLGPKRQQGDFQIPEGFYYIDLLNPTSNYHLSLHINYPNTSDSIRGNYEKLGGDIYMHGGCETIGCIPMTNDLIEEIYLINMYAMGEGVSRIPIHIFPVRLTNKNFNKLKETYFSGNVKMIKFWTELKKGYDYFEETHQLPKIDIHNLSGRYLVNEL